MTVSQLPAGFLAEIGKYPQLEGLGCALAQEPTVAVRLNESKPSELPFCLEDKVSWCAQGYYLAERPSFTFDPRWHQGLYYAQDASSMAITAAIRQIAADEGWDRPLRYLDACAAPGGKTTAAISALPKGSLVVANEYDFKRAEILAENLAKWGSPYYIACKGDTAKLRRLEDFFDIVAVDAPCSGEGMMRKDAKAVEQWSPQLVESCAALQKEILDNAWNSLAPGGYLIYSTCTFNVHENEENVAWLMEEHGAISRPISLLDNEPTIEGPIKGSAQCYRFIPGKARGEGLFMALLKKPGDGLRTLALPKAKPSKAQKAYAQVLDWLDPAIEWILVQKGDELYAQPAEIASKIERLASGLAVMSPGLHVATIKGKDLIPAHELALSTALRAKAFPEAEVDEATAIAYLQRQSVSVPDAPKGFVLLLFQGYPLGFVKNLGNRANNLYPKNWRIRGAKS